MMNEKLDNLWNQLRKIVEKHNFKVVLAKGGPGSTVPHDPKVPYIVEIDEPMYKYLLTATAKEG